MSIAVAQKKNNKKRVNEPICQRSFTGGEQFSKQLQIAPVIHYLYLSYCRIRAIRVHCSEHPRFKGKTIRSEESYPYIQ